jgi:hypothetical protein
LGWAAVAPGSFVFESGRCALCFPRCCFGRAPCGGSCSVFIGAAPLAPRPFERGRGLKFHPSVALPAHPPASLRFRVPKFPPFWGQAFAPRWPPLSGNVWGAPGERSGGAGEMHAEIARPKPLRGNLGATSASHEADPKQTSIIQIVIQIRQPSASSGRIRGKATPPPKKTHLNRSRGTGPIQI